MSDQTTTRDARREAARWVALHLGAARSEALHTQAAAASEAGVSERTIWDLESLADSSAGLDEHPAMQSRTLEALGTYIKGALGRTPGGCRRRPCRWCR